MVVVVGTQSPATESFAILLFSPPGPPTTPEPNNDGGFRNGEGGGVGLFVVDFSLPSGWKQFASDNVHHVPALPLRDARCLASRGPRVSTTNEGLRLIPGHDERCLNNIREFGFWHAARTPERLEPARFEPLLTPFRGRSADHPARRQPRSPLSALPAAKGPVYGDGAPKAAMPVAGPISKIKEKGPIGPAGPLPRPSPSGGRTSPSSKAAVRQTCDDTGGRRGARRRSRSRTPVRLSALGSGP